MNGVRGTAAATAVLAALTLAGCGSNDSSSVAQDSAPSSATQSATSGGNPPQGPTCAQVWRDGATLPKGYRGCVASATWVKAQVYECSDGHHLVTYAHTFYAVPGRKIAQSTTTLAKDHGFQHTMAVCGA